MAPYSAKLGILGYSLQLSLADRRGWCHPGDGNFHFKLEQFAFYKDRKYHNTDVYGARGNAFLVPLPVSPATSQPPKSVIWP